jgi:hypothetical protein
MAFAVHLSVVVTGEVTGCLTFMAVLAYFFVKLLGPRQAVWNPRTASRATAVFAGGSIAAQYLFIVYTGNVDSHFIIGTSDSRLYHDIARTIAINFTLPEQLSSFAHVERAADRHGNVVPNFGMYWFLGLIYTVVGVDAGPGTYVYINVLCAMAIAYYSTLIASHYAGKAVSGNTAALFATLIFLNFAVSDHAFHLRKDFLLMATLTAGIYYGVIKRWIIFFALSFLTIQLRAVFVVIFLIPIFYALGRSKPWFVRLSHQKAIVFLALTVIAVMFIPRTVLSPLGLASTDGDTSILQTLYVDFGGSAVFAQNDFLQWLYVILYPFPPLSPFSYTGADAWVSLSIFIANSYLFYHVIHAAITSKANYARYSLLLSLWSALFLLLLINLVSAAATGLFGVVEPRYKFASWVFSGIIMMIYRTSMAQKANLNT